MGLDMYLNARKFFSQYKDEHQPIINDIKQALGLDSDVPGKVNQIKMNVMYWRKANAIHAWFVKNVQNGVDDCNEYPVSHELLNQLRSDIAAVLDAPKRAASILPPQSGFFFGSTKIDEGYWHDLKETLVVLDKVCSTYSNPNNNLYGWEFTYESSW